MSRKYWMMRDWIESMLKDPSITLSEIACDAGNYDDAFMAGRVFQDLIHQGKISLDDNGRVQSSEQMQSSDKTQTPTPTVKNSDCDTCKWYEARAFRCLIGAGIDCEYEAREKR